jgi:hypothetical protein
MINRCSSPRRSDVPNVRHIEENFLITRAGAITSAIQSQTGMVLGGFEGDFARASAVAKQALAKATASRQERLVQEVRERLQLYAKGQPFRSAG